MFTFDIAPDDADQYRVTATSRDVSFWERTGKGRSLAAIERDARMSQLEEIAHLTAQRRGLFDGSLADFRETCDITPIDLDAEAAKREAEGEELDLDALAEAGPTQTAR